MAGNQTGWTHAPTDRGNRTAQRRRAAERTDVLARTALFEGLSKSHLRAVAKVSADRRFVSGQELVKEGASGSVFFVIVEGTAKVVRGGRTVKRLGPGDFFGEMSLLTHASRSASVVAESPLECLTLSASDLRSLLLTEPAIALRMLTSMAERLADADRRLAI